MAALIAMLAVMAASVPLGDAYRILGYLPYNGRSHNIMLKAMMEVLADRGHEVVNLSPFPQQRPRPNLKDLDLSDEFPSLVNTMAYNMTRYDRSEIIQLIGEVAGADLCQKVFQTQHHRDIMSGKHGKFDVVFTEIFGSDCWTAVAYKLDVPLISIVTAPDFAWMHDRVGSVDNPSYLITNNEPYAGKMNFWQRVQNTYMNIAAKFAHKVYVQDPSEATVRKHFGADTPPISELVRRTSLIMVNSHVSVNPARPVSPNVIHVGGLHLKDAATERAAERLRRLDADLARWMDGAEHGVILCSMGSLVRFSSFPRDAIQSLAKAFAAVPQRVLWKYESDDIVGVLPTNVRSAAWLPQAEILAHPKTVLFITHGGLMSTTESLFMGVPMLGIPLFADQMPNVELYKTLGIAERLDHTQLTKDNVLAAIQKLTTTDQYRVRAKEIATRYVDRPLSAADEAAWWTEYVIRHRGARHLRPLSADMPLYQYLLLDVGAFLLGVVIVVLLLTWTLIRAALSCIRPSPSGRGARPPPSKSKQQ